MKRKGFTLVELMIATGMLSMIVIVCVSLLIYLMRSMERTEVNTDLTESNARGTRLLDERIREAMTLSVSADGKSIIYTLPARTAVADSVTGEIEYRYPLVSDNIPRTIQIQGTNLRDLSTNQTLVQNIVATDPDPTSSQYGLAYTPFQMAVSGGRRTLVVNLITSKVANSQTFYTKLKTTIVLPNAR